MKKIPLAVLLILAYNLSFAETVVLRKETISADVGKLFQDTLLIAEEDSNRKTRNSNKQTKNHYADVINKKWEGKDILHFQTSMGEMALRHCIHFTAEPGGCVITDIKWKKKMSPESCYIQKGGLQTYIMIKYHTAKEKRAFIQFAVKDALTGEEMEIVSRDGSQKLIVKDSGYCGINYDID